MWPGEAGLRVLVRLASSFLQRLLSLHTSRFRVLAGDHSGAQHGDEGAARREHDPQGDAEYEGDYLPTAVGLFQLADAIEQCFVYGWPSLASADSNAANPAATSVSSATGGGSPAVLLPRGSSPHPIRRLRLPNCPTVH